MEKFKTNTRIVLDFMIDNHYSQHSLNCYEKIFKNLEDYLQENSLFYSPEFGIELLNCKSDIPFGLKGQILHEAVIKKLNAVYLTGSASGIPVSSRKAYSSLHLKDSFSESLVQFIDSIRTSFSETQIENIRRRCSLFMKYLQSIGKENVSDISYENISDYHFSELSHLKPMSRIMEEGAICHFLRFLSHGKRVRPSFYIYMYALETDTFIDIDSLGDIDQEFIHKHCAVQLPADKYHKITDELIHEFQQTGYVSAYFGEVKKALRYFELFLDFYKLDYSPEISESWLKAQRTKDVFQGSSWNTVRRALFLLKVYALTEKIDFCVTLPRGISGLSDMPEWMLNPLMNYSETRTKEKLDDDTVKNDIYSILRLYRFLISQKISSFDEVSADMLVSFNLSDEHLSSEGKNACNSRIRRFLRYLNRENIISNQYLSQALGYSAAKPEGIITILTPEEIHAVRSYITDAKSPLQLRDSAVMLLGTEMGIRGCDIVKLKISDINFKNKTIRFTQDKTDVEIQLAMPVSVGNAIFRYLKSGRPKGASSDLLFVSLNTPHKPLSRNVCYCALHRILPRRSMPGSGFHVTRKTFSTSKLRNNVAPERISSALGQRSVNSLTPYLSLDGERLSMCPLSLESLNIPWKGDFS